MLLSFGSPSFEAAEEVDPLAGGLARKKIRMGCDQASLAVKESKVPQGLE